MNAPQDNAPVIDADEILDGILEWVNIESPSDSGELVNVMMNRVEADLQATNSKRWDVQTVDAFGYSHGFLGLKYSVAYSSLMNLAITNDFAPVLPSKLDFGDLNTIAPSQVAATNPMIAIIA